MSRKPIDLVGVRFGRLVVTEITAKRSGRGDVFWHCICDCGSTAIVQRGNLKSGAVASCGCLARETSSALGKAQRKEQQKCSIEGCNHPAREFERTLCRLHGKRKRKHGDPLFVTPESVRADRQRSSILKKFPSVKVTTYRKLFGRHEHRVIGEAIAGRRLRTDEHVHHIDGNKQNNDPSNLMVLSAEDHARLHASEKFK